MVREERGARDSRREERESRKRVHHLDKKVERELEVLGSKGIGQRSELESILPRRTYNAKIRAVKREKKVSDDPARRL